MKYKFLILPLFLSVLVQSKVAFSQKKKEDSTNIWANNSIKIDGKLNDWNDSLMLYNDDTKFYYAISNNDENIYLAIKGLNTADISRIFAGGISFMINVEGKKKPGPKVTFPIIDRKGMKKGKDSQNKEKPSVDIKEVRKQMLSQIKEIKVEGFKSIIDGSISLYNTYGIQVAVTFDDNDNLIYEVAIPLNLLNVTIENSPLLAYNIKINGLVRPQMPGGQKPGERSNIQGRSGYDGFRDASNRPDNNIETSKLFSSTDFWIKSCLAQKQ